MKLWCNGGGRFLIRDLETKFKIHTRNGNETRDVFNGVDRYAIGDLEMNLKID